MRSARVLARGSAFKGSKGPPNPQQQWREVTAAAAYEYYTDVV